MLFICITKSEATLELNELNFDAKINADGSMDVKETWNIYISDTNTLFKTFKRDSSKYSGIENVTVKDVSKGINLSQINREMYHVTKNCYYGLVNSKGLFEIAWGVGLDNSSDTRKYEISYKVKDAVAKYKDYAEIYWQFVGEDFEIDAEKIKGTITLPFNAESRDDIKVWGHTENLNGEIYVTGLNKIEFNIHNYSSGRYVEVRSLFPNNMVEASSRIYNYNIYNKVIEEETRWANEANERRERRKQIIYAIFGIIGIISILFIPGIVKKIKKLKTLEKKIKPTIKLQYFRELPYEDATPAEALFVMSKGVVKNFSASFAANILDLTLKKYISLEAGTKGSGILKKDIIKITFLEEGKEELKEDQQLTLDFLKQVANDKLEISTEDITKYLEKHISKVGTLDKKVEKIIENFEEKRKIFNKKNSEEHEKYTGVAVVYFSIAFLAIFPIIGIPLAVVWIINGILSAMIAYKINVFSQNGIDEVEQWKAFKKYMQDFSLLKEKEVPSLAIWEKYLVFATAFGISDKVLKQLKVVYPEINDMNSSLYTYNYISVMNSVNIGNCINSSVYSAVGSSGSGGGGGFSGGGGGGRWPAEVAVDANF